MTTSISNVMAVGRPSDWFRQFVEFLVVGGATLLLIPLAWWLKQAFGLEQAEFATSMVAFYAAHVINDPHFGVTYALYYRRIKQRCFGGEFVGLQRWRYVFAGIVVPALLLGWITGALRSGSGERMGQLIQAMFFLVSWHYVKQGFGMLSVLCARRGIRFSPTERWFLLAHCFCGWAFAFVSPSGPSYEVEESGIVYWTLAIPGAVEATMRGLFFISAFGVAWVFFAKWKQQRVAPPVGPLVGFFVTVWLWSVYSSFDPLIAYVIPALHSIQYLYFVWLLKRNQAWTELRADPEIGLDVGARVGLRLLGLALSALVIGWIVFRGGPDLLDGKLVLSDPELRGGLGPTPYLAAIGTFVNIHHYFMDNVIWRRENAETRFLSVVDETQPSP